MGVADVVLTTIFVFVIELIFIVLPNLIDTVPIPTPAF
jgi:hypothetical protein